MELKYIENPILSSIQLGELRSSVGWDPMHEYYERVLGKTFYCLACFNENKLVGFIDVVSDGVTDAFLRDLIVHPDYQKMGIGKSLVSTTINTLKEKKVYAINVLFDEELLDFYKCMGFSIMYGGVIVNE